MTDNTQNSPEKPVPMTVNEAGRKGGETTAKRHGPQFYHKIGHEGGEATARRHGPNFYREIGRKGGQIGGPKGGQTVKRLIEEGKRAEESEQEG